MRFARSFKSECLWFSERTGRQAIIALFFPVLILLAFDNADQSALNHAARKGRFNRFIHREQQINRVTVVTFG